MPGHAFLGRGDVQGGAKRKKSKKSKKSKKGGGRRKSRK